MNQLAKIQGYLGSLDHLADTARTGDRTYVQPALKNLGTVAIPIIREVISPASFRNTDPEVTDITVDNVRRVRAVANKFKYGERRRGLQTLRFFGAGGGMALNRTEFADGDPASKGYDLNTLVFGDSANRGKYVLPVKAGVQYSDAISIDAYGACVDETFHNRAAEDGTLWDSAESKNSVNLFSRHYVKPGTLMLQVLTLNGRTMPPEALQHLLLCIGLAGAYGGQTSIYGVNVRNHIVGIYGGKMERAIASPYEAVKCFVTTPENAVEATTELAYAFADAYPTAIDASTISAMMSAIVAKVEVDDAALRAEYKATQGKVANFFDSWFGTGNGSSGKKPAKTSTPAAEPSQVLL